MKRFVVFCSIFLCSLAVSAADRFPIAEVLEPYITNGELPGIVTVIADKENILQTDTLGFADIESQRPMKTDTTFWIASQTKPVTAVAVMILVDEGKLSLAEPITTYLPELANLKVVAEKTGDRTVLVPVDKPITLAMALSHTAGLEFITPFQERHSIDSLPLSRYVTTVVMTPLRTQPKTAYHYSNMGINLAGAVVERVSGIPFEEFLQKRIFEPLGMNDTTFYPNADQLKRLATTYSLNENKTKLVPSQTNALTYPLDRKDRYAEPGGGLFSTPTDLVKFFQMLAGNGEFNGKRILSEAAVKEIQTKQTGSLPDAYGLGVTTDNGVFGHGGALGTNALVNTNNGRVLLYFIQHQGIDKSGEAQQKFFEVGNRP
ncbi:MAG: beta-lactamase family protein [Planctomycetaceae bacterium]|jgi:CubicO group peptidase (beta-lactamase class C family)|nr:beta-lactamase family protein [Planctomycetaceae bacterium]